MVNVLWPYVLELNVLLARVSENPLNLDPRRDSYLSS